jgi:capsular exopolysaccharide synthesis family protein
LGTYSKALEKAKDESLRQKEPLVDQVDEEQGVQQSEEVSMNLQPPLSENTPASVSNETVINYETENWDEKLQEIITGNSKQVGESIRMLRTKIFYPDAGEPPRSILVTSAIPGEGKSFICANLGVSISQGFEKEALLVECDLRRPSLSKFFGLGNSKGLVDYLQNGTPVEQLIQQTSMPKLSLLASGKPPKNPAELIDTHKMAFLIKTLVDQNPDRLIIFDSPPIQAAPETDVLAKRVDKVILVIRWGYARREHAKQLVELLGRDKILGVVFNAFEMSRLESKLQGYYYGYKDYYSSSYSKYYEQQPKKRWGKSKSS